MLRILSEWLIYNFWQDLSQHLKDNYQSRFICALVTSLLCPWIKHFTMRISAWWLQTSRKFRGQEFKEIHRNININSWASSDFSKHEVVIAMKSVQTIQKLVFDTVQ